MLEMEVRMRSGKALLMSSAAILIVLLAAQGFAQAPAPSTRIPHQVVINGQRQNGVYVVAPGGGLQSFSCDNPQQFVTPDGATQGWACYEQATGTWLLNALPPAGAQQVTPAPLPVVPAPSQPPAVVYQQAPVVVYQTPPVVYYSYPSYAYAYPRYPVVIRPAYRPSVVLGAAAINAAGRIAAAAIRPGYYGGYGRVYYGRPVHVVRGGYGRR
jgi:hypothetical protein